MINDYEATQPITTDAATFTREVPSNDEVISTLNGLIQTCKDGEEGYRQAADGVTAANLKTLFMDLSHQRLRFATEIQNLVRSCGGEPESEGSFTGALHRGWMEIKAAVAGNDEKAILSECERGEDSARKNYQTAFEKALPSEINEVLRTQFASIRAAHDQIKALRDADDHTAANTARTGY